MIRAVRCGIVPALALLVAARCTETSRTRPRQGAPVTPSKLPLAAAERGALAQRRHFEEGKRRLRAAQLPAAIEAFRRAVAADPTGELVANCELGLGSAFSDLGQHDRAVAAFEKVVALRPSEPQAYRSLAVALEAAGRFRAARQALEQTLALDPNQLSGYQDLAALAMRERDLEGAKKAYLRYELTRTRLIHRLGLDPDEKRRADAARALADARDEVTAKALGLALTDRSRAVRLAVIRALGELRLSQGTGPLRVFGERTRDPEERRLTQLSLQAIAGAAQPATSAPPAPIADKADARVRSGAKIRPRPGP